MSGQPNTNPSDQAKFRQQYLANLNLRARLDDVNLQANKVYARTGQLPVEPSDFRTTEEKLADVVRLRTEVRSLLSGITDGREANKISQELNPKQLLFYSQSAEAINKDLKPKYRLGIYADIFIPFLQNYMNNTANVNAIKSGTQQTSGRDVDLNSADIIRAMPTHQEIRDAVQDILGHTKGKADWGQRGEIFKATSIELEKVMTAVEAFYLMRKHLPVRDADSENEAYKLVNGVAQNILTRVQLERWLDKVLRAFQSRDMGSVGFQIDKGIEMMTLPDDAMDIIINANRIYPALLPARDRAGEKTGDDDVDLLPERKEARTPGGSKRRELDPNNLETFTKAQLVEKATEEGIPLSSKNKKTKKSIISAIELALLNRGQTRGLGGDDDEPRGKGMYGRGIISKPKLRRQDHIQLRDIDWTDGIKSTKRFVPFGRYIINKHRLDKDIVAIKRPAGSTIKSLPSEKVSRRLGQIIREIVGGGMPDFDDLEQLNDQEKAYLNKIATETNVKDRLSIPAPKKSEIDKEENEFEIMRGEIMSGNDNKDLVKKFKIVLLKLMNKGVIPKGQAKEILLELTSMGF